MSGAQSAGKRLAVPARQLALKPNLQILRRRRRPLLRGLEQPRRSTLADHVHRPSQLGPWVLINESWYKTMQTDSHTERNRPFSTTFPKRQLACSTASRIPRESSAEISLDCSLSGQPKLQRLRLKTGQLSHVYSQERGQRRSPDLIAQQLQAAARYPACSRRSTNSRFRPRPKFKLRHHPFFGLASVGRPAFTRLGTKYAPEFYRRRDDLLLSLAARRSPIGPSHSIRPPLVAFMGPRGDL